MNGEALLALTTLRHWPCAAWRAEKKLDALSLPAHATGCPGDEQLQENSLGVGIGVAVRTGVGAGVGTIGRATCARNSLGHGTASAPTIATVASHPLRMPDLDFILIWFSIPLPVGPGALANAACGRGWYSSVQLSFEFCAGAFKAAAPRGVTSRC